MIEGAIPHARSLDGDSSCAKIVVGREDIPDSSGNPDAFALALGGIDAILNGGRIVEGRIIGHRSVASDGKGIGWLAQRRRGIF